ncbi:MAG: pyrroline-5-carboxylate reductase [Undibacterium sp.]|nr:pyrroline-5-carboxylate reductase [Undibacterium sp.]
MMTNLRIGFIGGGNMASALMAGLQKHMGEAISLHVVDVNDPILTGLASQFGASTSRQMDQTLSQMDVVIFAVKPQQLHVAALAFAPFLQQQLVLSVAAGVRTDAISRSLQGYRKIVRSMPNTPASIGLGMTGLFALDGVSEQDKARAQSIMQAVGETLWVETEAMLDAVTAVSGSGPAYVFYLIEAMQAAAIELGFQPQQAQQLALATFNGAAQMALQSDQAVSILRERVSSKGGTTYAALCSMEESKVKDAISKAIHAAAVRGRELGDEFSLS